VAAAETPEHDQDVSIGADLHLYANRDSSCRLRVLVGTIREDPAMSFRAGGLTGSLQEGPVGLVLERALGPAMDFRRQPGTRRAPSPGRDP
jgi:hypothetical protein